MSKDDDRPRKSWSEIDKARNTSPNRRERREDGGSPRLRETSREYRSYKSQLNKLFDGSGAVPDALKSTLEGVEMAEDVKAAREAHQEMLAALTPRKILRAYRKFREICDFPRDKPALEKLLDLDEEDIVLEALLVLAELADAGEIKRSSSLKMRVQQAQMTVDTNEVKRAGDVLLEKLR